MASTDTSTELPEIDFSALILDDMPTENDKPNDEVPSSDNFDTSEFWKCQDEKEIISLNEKLLEISRNGPPDAFKSVLAKHEETAMGRRLDLDIVDKSGWSLLIHASFNGHYEIVEAISKHQENFYRQEYGLESLENEKTGIEELKYKYFFKRFISRKVKWNGSTALHLACARGHELIVQFLINKMINVYDIPLSESIDNTDYDLATPLHCAVLGKHYGICKMLLMNGAAIHKRDIRGKTPRDWAIERGLNHFIQLLQKYAPAVPAETMQCNEVNRIWDSYAPQTMTHSHPADTNAMDFSPSPESDSSMNHRHHHHHQQQQHHAMTYHAVQQHFMATYGPPQPPHHDMYHQMQAPYQHHQHQHQHQHHHHPMAQHPCTMPHPPPVLLDRSHSLSPYHGGIANNHNHHSRSVPPIIELTRSKSCDSTPNQLHQQQTIVHTPHSEHAYHPNMSPSPQPVVSATNTMTQQIPAKVECPQKSELETNVVTMPVNEEKSEQVCDVQQQQQKEECEQSEKDRMKAAVEAVSEIEREEKKVEEENKMNDTEDPAMDAMKFQNKYLEARCETLKKEKEELFHVYQQQIAAENERWKLRESAVLQQLEAKQKQIHEMRHTLRRMRHFLDSLPLQVRDKFYANNSNFSSELYDKKAMNNGNKENNNNSNNHERCARDYHFDSNIRRHRFRHHRNRAGGNNKNNNRTRTVSTSGINDRNVSGTGDRQNVAEKHGLQVLAENVSAVNSNKKVVAENNPEEKQVILEKLEDTETVSQSPNGINGSAPNSNETNKENENPENKVKCTVNGWKSINTEDFREADKPTVNDDNVGVDEVASGNDAIYDTQQHQNRMAGMLRSKRFYRNQQQQQRRIQAANARKNNMDNDRNWRRKR